MANDVGATIISKVKLVQTLTASLVFGPPRETKPEDFLNYINQLSIYQLTQYYTLITYWKIINTM